MYLKFLNLIFYFFNLRILTQIIVTLHLYNRALMPTLKQIIMNLVSSCTIVKTAKIKFLLKIKLVDSNE